MPTVRINVKPEILSWVQAQIEIDDLRSAIRDNFIKWLHGEKEPTLNQIEEFSKATHIPLGYFFLNAPPQEDNSFIEYRTVDSIQLSKPSRDLLDTIDEMERIQDWMKEYLFDQSMDNLDFVGLHDETVSIESMVMSIRDTLKIEKDWYTESKDTWDSFKRIRTKMEAIGIVVMMNGVVGSNTHRSLNIDEFRAFTMIDKLAPLIFINAHDTDCGRLFSLVHELAHIWYGENSLFNDKYLESQNSIERKCNAIAAEIIVPNDIFVQEWKRINDELQLKIRKLAHDFKCGMTVIARRALDNNFISQKTYKELADTARMIYFQNKENSGPGGDYYNTALSRIDKRFLLAINDSAYQGKTSFSEVYRLTNTTRKTFENIIDRARGTAS
ncbi:conserved protein of unknown function [Petrocella atlantisensis]|uniref:IrrE N-terminal-like domain-containing protein n=1 Tax=Petrocella atlantisensis TaxID=2173034 RepID=A0A3P7PVQ6_9FIRM|nr:ImmA/IrrE family metallo-endopeptidase [Petrocella atlantisensis]VDN47907.1 conserved protein of unknown function [Petrocella atlantisensis]